MSKLNSLSDRALDLAEYVGDNMKLVMRPSAGTLLTTGAKLGAIRAGVRVAGTFLRRNPVIAVATVTGAGLLWYAAYRRSRQAEQGNDSGGNRRGRQAIEGNATRVDARSGDANASTTASRRKSTTGARKRSGATTGARGGSRRRGADNSTSTTH